MLAYDAVVEASRGIRDGLAPLLADDPFLIVLGGCCTLVPGVAAALRLAHSGPLGLAYIDGHMDTYDPHTSPTGEAADMPVAIVAGIGDRALVELGTVTPLVAPRHIALLAHRDEDEVRRLGGLLPDALGAGVSHDAAAVQRDPERIGGETAREPARAGRPLLALDRRRRALVGRVRRDARPAGRRAEHRGARRAGAAARDRPGLRRARPRLLRRRSRRRRAQLRHAARRARPADRRRRRSPRAGGRPARRRAGRAPGTAGSTRARSGSSGRRRARPT